MVTRVCAVCVGVTVKVVVVLLEGCLRSMTWGRGLRFERDVVVLEVVDEVDVEGGSPRW
jgi:hypothetical protein